MVGMCKLIFSLKIFVKENGTKRCNKKNKSDVHKVADTPFALVKVISQILIALTVKFVKLTTKTII